MASEFRTWWQKSRLHSWWQKIKQHPVRSAITTISTGAGVLMVVVVLGYVFNWSWVGVNGGYPKITTKSIIVNGKPTNQDSEQAPAKTLWDYLQLLGVLAIPVVAGFGAAWFTAQQGKVSAEQNTDNQREAALQAYIDKISELLLKERLGKRVADGKLIPGYEQIQKHEQVQRIARVRTITVLTQLDTRRLSYVFAFLREAGLTSTEPNDNVVSLKNADLRTVNWSQANLSGANLSGANLSRADLSRADLRDANLSGAFLDGANLSEAALFRSNLSEAALFRANLSGAFLSRANLSRADLSGVNLSEAFLSGANLSRANLSGANLSGAFLDGANLSEAALFTANLSGAFLNRANLKDATSITPEELEKQAKSLKDATMPDGSIHP